jgi:hypothetical protein
MHICIVSQEGDVLLHRNLRCDPRIYLLAIRPYRKDLVVGVECIFNWYWLAE